MQRSSRECAGTIGHDPGVLWPDTLAVPNDGNLHVITNQLRRQADYHKGQGRREKPYGVFHVKIDGTPVHSR